MDEGTSSRVGVFKEARIGGRHGGQGREDVYGVVTEEHVPK